MDDYYVLVFPDKVFVTVPHENRPEMVQERILIDKICGAISEALGDMSNE